MSFLRKIIGKSDPSEEISQIVPLATCPAECAETECHSKFPNSVLVKGSDATDELWKSTKPYALHCLVSTGKTDWQHDACDEEGTLPNFLAKWADKASNLVGGTIKVNVSSLPVSDPENKSGDVLVLPYFVWVRSCPNEKIGEVMEELLSNLKHGTVPDEVKGVRIEVDHSHAFMFLCSHKTRDKRCGVTAPLMKREMCFLLRDRDLLRDPGDDRPGGVNVVFINHVGGHKYAANLIIYLRSGENVWFARCKPTNCKAIIDETVLGGGKVWPQYLRLAQRFNPVTW